MNKIITKHFDDIFEIIKSSKDITQNTKIICNFLISKINSNKNIFVCGNGGSYADASHFVGELTATYSSKYRRPLPFYLLGSNLAAVSGWSNDYDYKDYLSRELFNYGKKGDVLIILSTSGGNIKKNQSINLINTATIAKKKGIKIISLLGKGGGKLKDMSDYKIIVKSNKTATIQETHKIIFHSICEVFENYYK